MPFNGSGVYSAPSLPGSFNPAISGQDATPADWNTLLADLSSALSQTITSNGESTITQDIPMNSHKFTGVSNASARTQFPSMGQIQDGGGVYAADTGTANAMVITLSPALTTYAVGQRFRIKKSSSANTTAVTLNINAIGAGDVKWPDGTALAAGALPANAMFDVEVQDISTPTAPVFHLQTVCGPPLNNGGTVTGTITMSGAAFNEAVRVDVASATTTDIGAAASNYVRITGTTTITGLGTITSGVRRQVVFAAALTLTHNATSLILPTGANITTAAGDCALFESEGSGNWRCVDYQRANGAPLAGNVAFLANKNNVAQTLSDETWTKLTFGTESFDNGGYYDTGTSRWTPPAGTYLINGRWGTSAFGAANVGSIGIYVNGSRVYSNTIADANGARDFTVAITQIMSLNGTDYVELWGYVNTAGASQDVAGSAEYTTFSGARLP